MSVRSRSVPWFGTKGERAERLPEIAPAPFIPAVSFPTFYWTPDMRPNTYELLTMERLNRAIVGLQWHQVVGA